MVICKVTFPTLRVFVMISQIHGSEQEVQKISDISAYGVKLRCRERRAAIKQAVLAMASACNASTRSSKTLKD